MGWDNEAGWSKVVFLDNTLMTTPEICERKGTWWQADK